MISRFIKWVTEGILKRMASIDLAERRLLDRPSVIHFDEHSKATMPFENATLDSLRFREKRALFPRLLRAIAGHKQSIRALRKNPKKPATASEPEFLKALEERARGLGASGIGYARVPRDFIFRERGILWANAIVLTQPMDREIHKLAPSFQTMLDIIETYRSLGAVVNGVADFLRASGYGAHAAPAVSQYVDFPRLAEKAGLGLRGRMGILISPDNGPCQRVAAVFTSIENLPFPENNEHAWIAEFCRTCGRCIRRCPGQAIYESPHVDEHGQACFVDNAKCVKHSKPTIRALCASRNAPSSRKGMPR